MKQERQSLAFSDEELVPVLKTILSIIPVAAILIGLSNIVLERESIAKVVFTIPIFSYVAYQLVLKGWIRTVIYTMTLLVSAVITTAGFLGNGIHETAIVAFPVIVLLSTFLLDGRGVLISTGIVILSVALMSFGEMYGLFPTRPMPPARVIDVVAICAILSVDIVLVYYLTSKTKKGLNQAVEEVEEQMVIQDRIKDNLRLKNNLLREIHHRVKNNLSLINSLIDLEIISSNEKKDELTALQRRIQAIARVHDPLFQSSDYKEVDVRDYVERLIIGFSSALRIPDGLLEIKIESFQIPIEKAIPLGIILHELMSELDVEEKSKIWIELVAVEGAVHFTFDTGIDGRTTTVSSHGMDLTKVMVGELGANLEQSKSKTLLTFTA